MTKTIPRRRVGLIGYGKTGVAVATVLAEAADMDLCWIAKREPPDDLQRATAPAPLISMRETSMAELLQSDPVDIVVDFSSQQTINSYAEALRRECIGLVSAISNYGEAELGVAQSLARDCVVMSSPNITLGINYLMVASELLKSLAPQVDIEIIEEHFKGKKETSGTALRIARTLGVGREQVNSIRVGGIIGHHEVVFGFPFQTVRLTHDSISRNAFGTGTLFALRQLFGRSPGWYRYDDLIREALLTKLLEWGSAQTTDVADYRLRSETSGTARNRS